MLHGVIRQEVIQYSTITAPEAAIPLQPHLMKEQMGMDFLSLQRLVASEPVITVLPNYILGS